MTSVKKRAVNKNSENAILKKAVSKGNVKSRHKNGSILSTLLEFDEYYTKVFAVCADKTSHLGYLRPLMILLEFSCHGVPWFIATIVLLLSVHMAWHVEMLVNVLNGKLMGCVAYTTR